MQKKRSTIMTTDGERVCVVRVTYDELWRKCVSLFV